MSYSMRLTLFVLLFAMLCIKGGELCSAGATASLSGFFPEKAAGHSAFEPEPLRSRAVEFRGLTPMPSVSGRFLSPLFQDRR